MLAHEVPASQRAAPELAEARESESASSEFSRKIGATPAQLKALVHDLARTRAPLYWTDLLLSCGVGYATFWLASRPTASPLEVGLWLALSACAAYRATLFTHELAHASGKELRWFRVLWHLVCGIPLLVPAFLYEIHPSHHDRRSYGSATDGEYIPFASAPRGEAIASVAAAPFAVPALVLRFLVLAPLGWAIPPLRRFVLAKVSALVIDFRSERTLPARIPLRWTLQEAACFAWCAFLLWRAASGQLPLAVLAHGYAVITGVVFINALRVLSAHRYRSTGAPMSFVDQVLDSNDYPSGLAWLWAPLGLRYHATHHLFPNLPYHALGEAYRRLMANLPEQSAYRQTSRRSFFAGLDDVFRSRGAHERGT